jgi:hypothetical protein
MKYITWSALACVFLATSGFCQTAEISGFVRDLTGAVIQNSHIEAKNSETGLTRTASTSASGYYRVPFLAPGSYRIAASAPGFQTNTSPEVVLHAGEAARLDFQLPVASRHETVTIKADVLTGNDSAELATNIAPQFVQALPLNGRTFQALIELVPGVVMTGTDGQFQVNGQHDTSNYMTIDGASANVAVDLGLFSLGSRISGSLPGWNVLGMTTNLLPVEAVREFTVATSTYSADLGRVPGAQVQIVSRSGSNAFHGAAFDYLRNDITDANDWFQNNLGLPRAPLRQNDFGGAFGGPTIHNRTFFFTAYEGFRLRLPNYVQVELPSLAPRQAASGLLRDILDVYPIPQGAADPQTMLAPFAGSYSDPANTDSFTFRLDHSQTSKLTLFGRYSLANSNLNSRSRVPSQISVNEVNTRAVTVGATLLATAATAIDLRANYTRNDGRSADSLDSYQGATPVKPSDFLPSQFVGSNSAFGVFLAGTHWTVGPRAANRQRQINLIGSIALRRGTHSATFGIDYRRLTPFYSPRDYVQNLAFDTVPQLLVGSVFSAQITTGQANSLLFHNASLFAADNWKVASRLTLDYGLRWELNPAPTGRLTPLYPVTGFESLATIHLAPAGTPLYPTTYGNFAPRLGLAYRVAQHNEWDGVLKGGFGFFYDTGLDGVASSIINAFPHVLFKETPPTTFPLTAEEAAPPSINFSPPWSGLFLGFSQDHKLPRTYQWNTTLQFVRKASQDISLSYVGASGRALLNAPIMMDPNLNFNGSQINFEANQATSDYHAFQARYLLQWRKLNLLASYTWSHAIDDPGVPLISTESLTGNERASSTFDERHSFVTGFIYSIPQWRNLRPVMRGWQLQGIMRAHSSQPVDITYMRFIGTVDAAVRPDRVPGVPLDVADASAPNGVRINATAFSIPLADRQGDLPRDALRGFGLYQLDLGLSRDFLLHEKVKLTWKMEMFNVSNHPNFASPSGGLGSYEFPPNFQPDPNFGAPLTMANSGVSLSSLYGSGGPRSMQFSLRVSF